MAKSPKYRVSWKVGHAIRPRLCSPNTLFTFLFFRPKETANDLQKLPQMNTNPSEINAGTLLFEKYFQVFSLTRSGKDFGEIWGAQLGTIWGHFSHFFPHFLEVGF